MGPGPGEAHVYDGGYRLSGRFEFASGSRHATWLGAHVPVIEGGQRRLTKDGANAIFTLLFPRDGADVQDTWFTLGLKGTGSDSYTVDDLFVPHALGILRDHSVPPRVSAPLYRFSQSSLYARSFASIALGIARAMFDAFVATMRDTTPRGAARSRGANHVVQSEVGRAEAKIRSSRAWLFGVLERAWQDVSNGDPLGPENLLALRLASTWAIQQSREVVAALFQAAGAVAVLDSAPFERRFRDIHTLCQQIQGHSAHFETVGQVLMGLEPDRPLFTF